MIGISWHPKTSTIVSMLLVWILQLEVSQSIPDYRLIILTKSLFIHLFIKNNWQIIFTQCCHVKVSKCQKQIFLFSFEPKNEQIFFFNSALASKMSQIIKWRHFIVLIQGYLIQLRHLFFHLTHFGIKSFGFWFKWGQENLLLKFTDL